MVIIKPTGQQPQYQTGLEGGGGSILFQNEMKIEAEHLDKRSFITYFFSLSVEYSKKLFI